MTEIPVGAEFVKLVFGLQDECQNVSLKLLPSLGKSAPKCYEDLGTGVSYLDRMASCFWGCRGGDHIIERIIGRTASSASASLRLLLCGYYDESLALTRSLGESSNLLLLFNKDSAAYSEWIGAPEDDRKRKFSAVKVRLKLEEEKSTNKDLFELLVIGKERYGALSEISVHLTPETSPQMYNPVGVPILGARYQQFGFLSCLNELCRVVGVTVAFAPKLLGYEAERKKEVRDAGITLLASMGRIDVLTDRSPVFKENTAEQSHDS